MITYSKLGKYGRLGNQMFQIAGTIGIAIKHDYSYGFPEWESQEHFKTPLPACKYKMTEKVLFPWGYHNAQIPDNVSIEGYLQSEMYFRHCHQVIKSYFKFKEDVLIDPGTIAIHLRLGDYGSEKHPILPFEYYINALSLMPENPIIVFSEDPDKAKEYLGLEAMYICNDPELDMNIMSKCDYHIIGNSTFSWWGAWLSDSKKIVAPKMWFGNGLDSTQIYCPSWIIM